jgi:hypothetical protein
LPRRQEKCGASPKKQSPLDDHASGLSDPFFQSSYFFFFLATFLFVFFFAAFFFFAIVPSLVGIVNLSIN